MRDVLLVILVIVAGLGLAYYASRFMMKRAMRRVVALFRAAGAVNPKGAVTAEQLGLVKPGMFGRMFRVRDYGPDALNLLGQANVIKVTADGRLYLSEEELERSAVKTFAGIK